MFTLARRRARKSCILRIRKDKILDRNKCVCYDYSILIHKKLQFKGKVMKKMAVFVVLCICAALILTACLKNSHSQSNAEGHSENSAGQPPAEDVYHKINAEEAKVMMDEQEVTVVDVRTAEEYAGGHIPGAVPVPLDTIGEEPPVLLPDKNAVLLVYCRSGVRSKRAAERLAELGYQHIYDFGGIIDWPYETQTGEYKA